jgi:hypothetical protein
LEANLFAVLASVKNIRQATTSFTAKSAAKTLNFFSHSSNYTTLDEIDEYNADGYHETQYLTSIFYKNEKALSVADACNAWNSLFSMQVLSFAFPPV